VLLALFGTCGPEAQIVMSSTTASTDAMSRLTKVYANRSRSPQPECLTPERNNPFSLTNRSDLLHQMLGPLICVPVTPVARLSAILSSSTGIRDLRGNVLFLMWLCSVIMSW